MAVTIQLRIKNNLDPSAFPNQLIGNLDGGTSSSIYGPILVSPFDGGSSGLIPVTVSLINGGDVLGA